MQNHCSKDHYLNKNCARGLVLKVRVLELGRLTESDKIFTLVEQDYGQYYGQFEERSIE